MDDLKEPIFPELLQRVFRPAYLQNLEGFLTELERVGLDAEQTKERWRNYAYFDSILSEAGEDYSQDSLQDWTAEIAGTLTELQRRRFAETEKAGTISSYDFNNQAVHAAYLGSVEREVLQLKYESWMLRRRIVAMQAGITPLQDLSEVHRICGSLGIIPTALSKELLQERLVDVSVHLSSFSSYLAGLVQDAQQEKYKFIISSSR